MSTPSVVGLPVRRWGLERADLWDAVAVMAVGALVVVTAMIGSSWERANPSGIRAGASPLQGEWLPRWTSHSALAITLALLVVVFGPQVARGVRWRVLPWLTWLVATAWLVAVAAVDPWQTAFVERLTSKYDYLAAVPLVDGWGDLLGGFAERIPTEAALRWPTHVAGHPPGALAPFVGLDRLGLGGPGPSAVFLVLAGASAAAGLVVATSALAGRKAGRHVAPFAALMPGAVWIAVSGDALILATTTWAVALVAVACASARKSLTAMVWGVAGGVLLGLGLYLSYGMVLMLSIAAAVLLTRGTWQLVLAVTAGVLVVVVAVTVAGFSWWEGYHLLVERYHDGAGGERLYSFWAWANLAAFALAVGPAAVVGVRRIYAALRLPHRPGWSQLAALVRDPQNAVAIILTSALTAVAVATLGGLSKGEVERIWLPFGIWFLLAVTAIPMNRTRLWLAMQAVVVLAVQHLVFTPW